MDQDELDRILSGEEDISSAGTSSRFVSSVMNAVRREGSVPTPIPFPWRRAMPGMAVCAIALLALTIFIAVQLAAGGGGTGGPMPRVFVELIRQVRTTGAQWIAMALLVSLASMRLVRGFYTRL